MSIPSRLLPPALVVLMLVMFQGCATILQGPMEKVKFDSKPSGATLYVNGLKMGRTPRMVVFSRFQHPRVRLELEGFEPYEFKMGNNGQWTAMEVDMFCGYFPIIIDVLTGSLYQLNTPSQPGLTTNPWYNDAEYDPYKMLFVGVTLKPLPGARKIGQMQRKQ